MNKKLICIMMSFMPFLAFSQDVIVRGNGEIIECKITKEDSAKLYFTMKRSDGKVSTYIDKHQIESYHYDTTFKAKPSKSFMFEVNFNPFHEDGIFSFDYFQTKFWLDEKTALRLGVQLDFNKNSVSDDDYKTDDENNPTIMEKSFLIGIKPGIEFRILDKSKISPYWGIELSYRNKTSKAEYTDYNRASWYDDYEQVDTKVSGAWREVESGYYSSNSGYYAYTSTSFSEERAFYSLGGNLLLGTDFFFVKNFYFGIELGLGYERIKFKQIEIDNSSNTDVITLPSSKSVNFGFYYNSAIRLGFWF